jgi:hypothetical protein
MKFQHLVFWGVVFLAFSAVADEGPHTGAGAEGNTGVDAAKPDTSEGSGPGQADAAQKKLEGANQTDSGVTVLIMDLKPRNTDKDTAQIITDLVASALAKSRPDIAVLTRSDVQQAIDLEMQKQAAGCDDDSCLAEIAGALGARFVIFGSAGSLGKLRLVNLSVYDSVKATSVARKDVQADSLEALPPLINTAVEELFQGIAPAKAEIVAAKKAETPAVLVEDGPRGSDRKLLSPMFIGGGMTAAIGVGGAVLFGYLARTSDRALSEPQHDTIKRETDFAFGAAWLTAMAISTVVALTGVGFAAYASAS